MFVKNLLVLTLGALAVSASPIKPQGEQICTRQHPKSVHIDIPFFPLSLQMAPPKPPSGSAPSFPTS